MRGRAWADRVAAATGLTLYPTRMAVELRPPVGVDKGDAVAALVGRHAGRDVRRRRPRRPRRVRRARRSSARAARSTRWSGRGALAGGAGRARGDAPTSGSRDRPGSSACSPALATRRSRPPVVLSRGDAPAGARGRRDRRANGRPDARAPRCAARSRTRRARRRPSRVRVSSAAAVWLTSNGCTLHAVLAQQVVRAGLAREAQHRVALVEQRALHRDEVEPVADGVHEQHVGALQRRRPSAGSRRACRATTGSQSPVAQRSLTRAATCLDLAAVVAVLGERLRDGLSIATKLDLLPPRRACVVEQLVEREEARARCSSRARAGRCARCTAGRRPARRASRRRRRPASLRRPRAATARRARTWWRRRRRRRRCRARAGTAGTRAPSARCGTRRAPR